MGKTSLCTPVQRLLGETENRLTFLHVSTVLVHQHQPDPDSSLVEGSIRCLKNSETDTGLLLVCQMHMLCSLWDGRQGTLVPLLSTFNCPMHVSIC